MKMLMESFNKFLKEEESPELEMAMDELLDDILEEGMLNEYGAGDEFDHLRDSPDEEPPSKQEIKAGIKQAVKSSEAQKAAQEIEKEAQQMAGGDKPTTQDYIEAAKSKLSQATLADIFASMAGIPMFAGIGAIFGSGMAEPHHSHSIWQTDPEAVQRAVELGTKYGAYAGAAVGLMLIAYVIATAIKQEVKDSAEKEE